jgi:hypothetical protein
MPNVAGSMVVPGPRRGAVVGCEPVVLGWLVVEVSKSSPYSVSSGQVRCASVAQDPAEHMRVLTQHHPNADRISMGRVQREGEPVQEIRAAVTVIIPPDVRHWHGSAADKLFAHLAMSELNDKGQGTAWFEHVLEEDYNAAPAPVTWGAGWITF